MATASTHSAFRAWNIFFSPVTRLIRAVQVWRDHQDTSRQLRHLSRHELADIGIDGDPDEFALRMAEAHHHKSW